MNVQVIECDGEPQYAVLPWAQYQALLQAAGAGAAVGDEAQAQTAAAATSALSELRSLREAKGLALEDLARGVGISPHYLGMIEKGERQPDAAIQRALARTLGVAGWGSES